MTGVPPDLDALRRRLHRFAAERDWEQFHSPRNLATALIVEAAELLEHFQWMDGPQSEDLAPETRARVELELADVFIYLVRLADRLGVDLMAVAARKIEINEQRYPAEKVRGSSRKYDEY